jgi:hypothetical protein
MQNIFVDLLNESSEISNMPSPKKRKLLSKAEKVNTDPVVTSDDAQWNSLLSMYQRALASVNRCDCKYVFVCLF